MAQSHYSSDDLPLRSRLIAGVLGIIFGVVGVHNFYLRRYGVGWAQIGVVVLSLGFLSPVAWLWGFIEGVLILTGVIDRDGKGLPLSD